MDSRFLTCVSVFAALVPIASAGEYCKAYTDENGTYHEKLYCDEYCCFIVSGSNASISYVLVNNLTIVQPKTCCSEAWRQVPANLREDKYVSWLKHHFWVPIAAGVIAVLAVAVCICSCCCGCCSCCKKGPCCICKVHH